MLAILSHPFKYSELYPERRNKGGEGSITKNRASGRRRGEGEWVIKMTKIHFIKNKPVKQKIKMTYIMLKVSSLRK